MIENNSRIKIAFIGLGNMGKPMAQNLAKKKYDVRVYDKNKINNNDFKSSNIYIAESIEEVCKGVDLVITMLPNGDIVKDVLLGDKGVIYNVNKKTTFIDCSTIDYKTTINIAKQIKKSGSFYLDAPVSGGVSGAINASLTFMIGGDKGVYQKYISIFNVMGKKIFHVGPSGSGQTIKTCNNMILGINMIALSEAFSLSKKLGIDSNVLFDVSSSSTGCSWAMLNHLPIKDVVENSAANNNFKGGYAADLMSKDLKIAKAALDSVKLKSPLARKASELYEQFCLKENKKLDYSAIIKLISNIT